MITKHMKLFFLAIFITLHTIGFATEYYVSPSGNNANLGTIGSPFKTITYGLSKMKGGDVLYVRTGTYVERVVIINISGTASLPTKIIAFPGEFPVIDGQGNLPGSEGTMVRIYSDYVHFSGFEVKNCNTSGSWAVGLGTGIYVGGLHSKISNCKVHHTWGFGIFAAGDYSVIEYCEVYQASFANSVYGGTVNNGTGLSSGRDPANGTTDYSILRHNIVHDIWGEGLSTFEATHTIIEDNIIYNCFSCALYISDATDCLTQRNLVYQTTDMRTDTHQAGLQIGDETYNPESARNTFINNIVMNCERNLLMGKFKDVIVANNIFVNSIYFAGVQIWAGQHGNGVFSNNIIVQEDGLYPIWVGDEPLNTTWFANVKFNNNLFSKIPVDSHGPYTYIRSPGDVIGDPQLAKTGGTGAGILTIEYFKLLNTSPAIKKGAVLPIVTEDIFINLRDTEPDIGPHENSTLAPVIKVSNITVTGQGGATAITTDKGTLQLIAAILPIDATNKTVTWSLTNGTGQAIINSSGLVTAIVDGTVTARATANDGSGIFGTLVLTISNQIIAVTGISVIGAGGATMIHTGGTLQLNASVSPSNATNKSVTWSITNGTGQASINASGLLTAIAPGTVTARAVANDGSSVYGTLIISIANQVIYVSGITVTGAGGLSTITVNNGTLQLIPTVLPSNATNKTVIWSLVNGTGSATISPTGLVTAVSNGTVTAVATASDGSGVFGFKIITISFVVANQPPAVIISTPASGKYYYTPATLDIDAEASDADGTISNLEIFFGSSKIGETTSIQYSSQYETADTGTFNLIAVATDNLNTVSYSEPVVIHLIPREKNPEFITLYPSPNDGNFRIELSTPLEEPKNLISIINMAGKIIHEETISNEEFNRDFNLINISPGVYVLVLTSDRILSTKIFTKL